MTTTDSNRPSVRTIRELGGEVWAELYQIPIWEISVQMENDIVEMMMAVLARYSGYIIENDDDFPVMPTDLAAFAAEVNAFCPDIVNQGTGDVPSLAKEMAS